MAVHGTPRRPSPSRPSPSHPSPSPLRLHQCCVAIKTSIAVMLLSSCLSPSHCAIHCQAVHSQAVHCLSMPSSLPLHFHRCPVAVMMSPAIASPSSCHQALAPFIAEPFIAEPFIAVAVKLSLLPSGRSIGVALPTDGSAMDAAMAWRWMA
jgi:hypothetical protein